MRVVRCEDKDEGTASADSAVGGSTTFVGWKSQDGEEHRFTSNGQKDE